MRNITQALLLLLAGTAAFAGEIANDCSPEHVRLDGGHTYTRQETIEAGNLPSLAAFAENSPVTVSGGQTGGYTIVVCKAATTEKDLDAIRVTVQNGELRAQGPSGERWLAVYDIRVPHGANLTLQAENGPVAVRDYDGSLVVRAKNGPLSLKAVDGSVDATTVNGPMTLSGGSGNVKLRATNGPLTVRLDGSAWSGAGLDAQTVNGPVSLKLPQGYASGVVVEAHGGPIACKAEGCPEAALVPGFPSDREPRTIQLGSGPVLVRLATENGPVAIKGE